MWISPSPSPTARPRAGSTTTSASTCRTTRRICFIENDRTVGIPSVPMAEQADGINMPGPMLPGWKLVDILPELTRRTERWIADAAKAAKGQAVLPLPAAHVAALSRSCPRRSSKASRRPATTATSWCRRMTAWAACSPRWSRRAWRKTRSSFSPATTARKPPSEVSPGAYDRIQQASARQHGRTARREARPVGRRPPRAVPRPLAGQRSPPVP